MGPRIIILLLLAVVAPQHNFAFAQTVSEQEIQETKLREQRLQAWKTALRQVAQKEKAILFVDVAPDSTPPNIRYARPHGVASMRALALAFDLTWKQIDGVQTFSRLKDSQTANSKQDIGTVYKWIENMSEEEFSLLCQSKLGRDKVPDQFQPLIQRLASWEPSMSTVLLDKGNRVKIGLTIFPSVNYTDPHTGKPVTIALPLHPKETAFSQAENAEQQDNDIQFLPLDRTPAGALTFGAGSVLSLHEIVTKATATFKVRYDMDTRIAQNYYFVCGSFTQDAFEDVLKQITPVPAVIQKIRRKSDAKNDDSILKGRLKELGDHFKVDITQLRDRLQITGSDDIKDIEQRFGDNESLDAGDLLQGKTGSVASFADGKPGLASFLQSLGLRPESLISFSVSFGLVIQSDGFHPTTNADTDGNGQPAPSRLPNYTSIGL